MPSYLEGRYGQSSTGKHAYMKDITAHTKDGNKHTLMLQLFQCNAQYIHLTWLQWYIQARLWTCPEAAHSPSPTVPRQPPPAEAWQQRDGEVVSSFTVLPDNRRVGRGKTWEKFLASTQLLPGPQQVLTVTDSSASLTSFRLRGITALLWNPSAILEDPTDRCILPVASSPGRRNNRTLKIQNPIHGRPKGYTCVSRLWHPSEVANIRPPHPVS